MYRVPDKNNLNIFFDRLNAVFGIISSFRLNTVIAADFNIDFKSNSAQCKQLNSLIHSYGLNVMLRDEITRPGLVNEGTCIDNVRNH